MNANSTLPTSLTRRSFFTRTAAALCGGLAAPLARALLSRGEFNKDIDVAFGRCASPGMRAEQSQSGNAQPPESGSHAGHSIGDHAS